MQWACCYFSGVDALLSFIDDGTCLFYFVWKDSSLSFFFILHLNAVLFLCLCFRSVFGPHADEGLAVSLCSSDISSLMKFACPPPPPLWLPPFPHQLLFPTHRCLPPVCLASIYFDLCPPPFLLNLYFHNPPFFFFIIFLHLPASFFLLRYFWPSFQWYPFVNITPQPCYFSFLPP